jgi:UDP-N-acetylmuramyl tripeptide synthase
MRDALGTMTGKAVRHSLRLKRSGGQALPGLIIEKLFPNYMVSMLSKLPGGIIIITGTNGKTTTTKMVTELLRSNGKKVLTNATGSNLTRGIVSSISQHAKASGRLNYDLAILEVDEATARLLVGQIKPRWVLGLNVSRDQLDRFGEVDTIATYIGAAMAAATEGIIVNGRDPYLLEQANAARHNKKLELRLFGAAPPLAKYFPSDYALAAIDASTKNQEKSPPARFDVELSAFDDQQVTYKIAGHKYQAKLKLTGQHNFLNGAAALTLCRQLLPETPAEDLVNGLADVSLAFGRGEKYQLKNGSQVELVLVKNPASFSQALSSYSAKNTNLMIAINDNIADGRDVSWLWDVNFEPLAGYQVAITSGRRAVDMALRLSYDDIKVANIEPSPAKALKLLSDMNGPRVILATYTAMLSLYSLLTKQGEKIS